MEENPIRRVRRDLRLTQKDLSDRLLVTPQTVLMLEQGLFNSVPQEIAIELGVSNRDYHQWVIQQRRINSSKFHYARTNEGWVTFRLSVSPSFRGFCRMLVFQPSILREYELQRQRNRQLLSEALIDVGIRDDSLRALGLVTRSELANAAS